MGEKDGETPPWLPSGRKPTSTNKLGYELTADPYVDPASITKKGRVKMLDPDNAFKVPKTIKKSTNKLGYEYIEHKDTIKDPKEIREKYRDVQPKPNVLTNPAKKGGGGSYNPGVLFGMGDGERKFPEYQPDPYDAAKEDRRKELDAHRDILEKAQRQPFSSMSYGNGAFSADGDVYHYNQPTHVPREPKPDSVSRVPDRDPFKPSNPMKRGALPYPKGGLLAPLPEYQPDPLPDGPVRKPEVENPPPPFVLNAPKKRVVSQPAVTTMMRNMRRERPSSFARPRF